MGSRNSLLVSLRNYRPRDNHDPLENYITEAFVWLLKNSHSFSHYFIQQIMENHKHRASVTEYGDWQWQSQKKIGDFYPDMIATLGSQTIIFENKVWSNLHDNQIENYRQAALKEHPNHKIVLITANQSQHAQSPDIAILWSDVYNYITDWLDSSNETQEYIFRDFQCLLEHEGLSPPAPVSHQSITHYFSAIKLEQQLERMVKASLRLNWEEKLLEISPTPPRAYHVHFRNQWGRIGLEFRSDTGERDWCPGIFIGFLLDGSDHKTTPSDPAKGPDFCLILDFNREYHSSYPLNPTYQKLLEKLRQETDNCTSGWDFYHHLEDKNVNKPNYYHPVHLRKPMLEVLRGTTDHQAQVNAFVNNAIELLVLAFKVGEINVLIEDNLSNQKAA